jgi:hypothetical protein
VSLNFGPKLLVLEAREVPAAFSFKLPDGTIGSGLFTTPDGVNPALASQTFNLNDLSVTKNNATYVVQPGATATYANGALVSVSAVANGPDTINLTPGFAQVGPYSAAVAYDVLKRGIPTRSATARFWPSRTRSRGRKSIPHKPTKRSFPRRSN